MPIHTYPTPVGHQLDGQTLHERQKQLREQYLLSKLNVIAVEIQTPENIGSIFRVADAAGCAQVVFVNAQANLEFAHRARKLSRSCDQWVDWHVFDHQEFHKQRALFDPLIAVEITSGSTSLYESSLPENCSFVVGNERCGIPEDILHLCKAAVHIPMFGVNGSMNVSHALAICLFEHRRRYSPSII